jgi:hypothetical protein
MTLDPNAPPLSPVTTLQNQVAAGVRHLVTAGGTAFTILGALAFLPPDKAQMAVEKLQMIGSDINKLTGDLSALWIIIGPAVMLWMGKIAVGSASLKSQLKSIARNPAVQIPPESKIIVPPPVAAAVPIPQVVPPQ